LLTIEIEPLALPADVGAKVAVKDAVEPAAIFSGVPAPLTLKAAPETEIWETVKVALPWFESETVAEALPPTLVLPKFTEPGVTVSRAWVATPVPVRPMDSGEFGALLVMEMLPEALPAEVGANFAVNEVD